MSSCNGKCGGKCSECGKPCDSSAEEKTESVDPYPNWTPSSYQDGDWRGENTPR